MLTKIDGKKFTIHPKTPKENESLCDNCGGTGWLIDEENGFLEKCTKCNNGIIELCEYCGNPKHGICINELCRIKRDKKEEEERLDNAKHYSIKNCPSEFRNMFFHELYGFNDGYFSDIEDFGQYCFDNNIEMPSYVWGTAVINFTLDARDIISQTLEESYEDAFYHVKDNELSKLQNACDDFIKCHNGVLDSYIVDYDICIEID